MEIGKVLDEFEWLVGRIERTLVCQIVVDVKIFGEVLIRAQRSLEKLRLEGLPKPHDHKKAGHYAFWIRKLKPFRVYRVGELMEQIRQYGDRCDITGLLDLMGAEAKEFAPRNSHRYVNEWIAIWTGIGFVLGPERARDINMTAPFLRDFLAGLRYDAYTPDNLSLLFESIAQQNRK